MHLDVLGRVQRRHALGIGGHGPPHFGRLERVHSNDNFKFLSISHEDKFLLHTP